MEWRIMREAREAALSPYAKRSADSLGRRESESKCPIRTEFERDHNRILYSAPFRRLRHKTQVFFNTRNDRICTRMEHVLYVGSISTTIARTLELNHDLTYAIALGHDLGHAPFGHTGEKALDACVKRVDPSMGFSHEAHSLRVVDRLAARRPGVEGCEVGEIGSGEGVGGASGDGARGIGGARGLNLTFETRDGIACHCGELYAERVVRPDRAKTSKRLYDGDLRRQTPATLEGCVVRMADKIAYVGRDIEDAVRAGIAELNDFRREALVELGATNGQIINTLVSDLIENSHKRDYIALSEARGAALQQLLEDNVSLIYRADRIEEYDKTMRNTMEGLFSGLYNPLLKRGADGIRQAKERALQGFAEFIDEQSYGSEYNAAQATLDYIAGMTDGFAIKCYEELYWL